MARKVLIEVTLTHERDTKGTRVFSTQDPASPVTQIYIRKPQADSLPNEIVLKVEA